MQVFTHDEDGVTVATRFHQSRVFHRIFPIEKCASSTSCTTCRSKHHLVNSVLHRSTENCNLHLMYTIKIKISYKPRDSHVRVSCSLYTVQSFHLTDVIVVDIVDQFLHMSGSQREHYLVRNPMAVISKIEKIFQELSSTLIDRRGKLSIELKSRLLHNRRSVSQQQTTLEAVASPTRQICFPGATWKEAWRFSRWDAFPQLTTRSDTTLKLLWSGSWNWYMKLWAMIP